MATTEGTSLWTAARNEVDAVLLANGNTITITPITLSSDTDEWGNFTITEGTPFTTSAVNYDTETLRKDFGQSVILNSGESMLLARYNVEIGDNDIITIDGISYKPILITPLKAADVVIAKMVRVGLKQN